MYLVIVFNDGGKKGNFYIYGKQWGNFCHHKFVFIFDKFYLKRGAYEIIKSFTVFGTLISTYFNDSVLHLLLTC